MFHKFYWIDGIHGKQFFVSSRNGFYLWKSVAWLQLACKQQVMRIKKSLYFLTESLMRSIAGRFYHFREHVFQKETRVDSSIIFQHVPENTDSGQIPGKNKKEKRRLTEIHSRYFGLPPIERISENNP